MHFDPVTATVAAGAVIAAASAVAGSTLDPLVLVSAVTALGAVATALVNGRMSRQNANIAVLRADTATAVARAEVAETRADRLATELDSLRRDFNHISAQFAMLTVWSQNVAAAHGLNPPPIPE